MILYQSTVKEFCETVDSGKILQSIESTFRTKLGRNIPPAERSAYINSLPQMERVVRRSGIADDCGVLIEYVIPLTSNRIDFIVAGQDEHGNNNFIIVELKQWQKAEVAYGEGVVSTFVGGNTRETTHPSYQATSYRQFMFDFNENISQGTISAYSCAYLHNYEQKDPEPLLAEIYLDVIEQSPIYFRDDQEKLESFLAKFVKYGKGTEILYQIESGKVKPSKKLIDHVSGLFEGNQEFVLLDEQKVAFEKARSVARNTSTKSVVIIKGGPGTGKSVISVNLLGQLLIDQLNAVFVAPNASFRDVMVKRLAKEHSKVRVKNLFKGSAGFVDADPNTFDALIIDEAHRLKRKGAFMYRGINQVEDVIRAGKTSIFFIDDDQAIRPDDIGSVKELKRLADEYDAEIHEIELTAQFRCSGAEGYINWLNHVFQLKETANYDGWEDGDFEFKVFDDPNEMRRAIKAKHDAGFKARVLAGYAWKWTSAREGNPDAEVEDVSIPEFDFSMPWNSRKVGTTWAEDDEGIHQVGCIHTSQGLEFDYVGVIIGNDLQYDPETMTFVTSHENYKDGEGKKGLKDDPKELNRLVRNIYKVLMTRGMKGCYVYTTSPSLKNYLNKKGNS
ncbi:DUF2075 domain-containing protein [Candidatus Saccharibacteria bacterium]|nr:DUF2075 domain-containing protein [Candidatus Saccharibacteria bacterium]MCB9821474.1 DUF2075 domain-containing protein [Candidatus Nomurabacteria bacterium]